MSDIVEEMGGYMGDGSEFNTPPMTQIDEPNLDKIDQEITDILLEHLVLANDNGQPYIKSTDTAVEAIKALIATQVQEARIDEIKRMREAMTFAHMTPSIYAAERIKNILGDIEL